MIDLSTLKYGDKVRLIGHDVDWFMFVAYDPAISVLAILINSRGAIEQWRPDHIIALAPKKHKLVGFINVYSAGPGLCWRSKEDIPHSSPYDNARIACIDLSRYDIEYESGEGL